MKKISTNALCRVSLIAALYFCVSLVFAPISFGNIQMRIAEALTILPALSPLGVPGVTIGCALANLYGAFTGANILGIMDVFFGTLATFIAALLTRMLRNITFKGLPIASTLPPIIVNAIVIGAELAFVIGGKGKIALSLFFVCAIEVAAGQLLSCTILGLILFKALKKGNIEI